MINANYHFGNEFQNSKIIQRCCNISLKLDLLQHLWNKSYPIYTSYMYRKRIEAENE